MKSPAFQFYPDSWLSSMTIALMTPAEEGAFIRLLCNAWLQPDCGLPDDDNALAELSRLRKAWPRSAALIRSKFEAREGRLFNLRLLAEREKQAEWSRKSAIGGKQSATKRQPKSKGGSDLVDEWYEPNGNSSSPSSSPSPLSGGEEGPKVVAFSPPPPPPGNGSKDTTKRTPPWWEKDWRYIAKAIAEVRRQAGNLQNAPPREPDEAICLEVGCCFATREDFNDWIREKAAAKRSAGAHSWGWFSRLAQSEGTRKGPSADWLPEGS